MSEDKLFSRFSKRVLHLENGCWLWIGAKAKKGYGVGYGKIKVGSTSINAHKFAFEAFRFSVPDGLEIDHLCRNRSCVNPFHLEAVTHQINCRRGKAFNPTHCPKGHEYTEENAYISKKGSKVCRICRNESGRRNYRLARLRHKKL